MIARLALLIAVAAAGCNGALVDPCEGKAGACIGVHLDSTVTPLDQIRITLDRRADAVQLTPASPSTLELPVRFAIELPPAGATATHLDFVGLQGGVEVASAERDVTLPPSGHALLAVTLTQGASGDAGMDLSDTDGADLAGVDAEPPDLLGLVPLTINYIGTGTGQVTANGMSCAKPGCVIHFLPGTIVNLLAAADAPVNVFNTWSGACSGTASACAITITAASTVNADFRRAYRNLTLTNVLLAGGSGTATPSPVGISCGTNCWSYPTATPVTLSQTPGGSSTFAGWGATSCGRNPMCAINVVADTAVYPSFTGAAVNYVFVTSTTYSVSQVAGGADALCQARAAAVTPALPNPTAYKAWIAIGGNTASSKLGSARGWVRLDGLPFADSVASLTAGGVLYPVGLADTNLAASGTPWTGANGDGTLANNCVEFTLVVGNATGGVPLGGARAWSSGSTPACSGNAPLICFGTTESTAISLTAPAGSRTAFLSQSNFSPGSSATPLDDARSLCNGDAQLAGLAGTYHPYLETVGAGGLSGLNTLTAGPWARRDGVLIAALPPQVDFAAAGTKMLAPLDQLAGGSRVAVVGQAWTGANSNYCVDWTTNMNSLNGGTSSFNQVGTTGNASCDKSLPLFCLQE